jgi:hypothetical protein
MKIKPQGDRETEKVTVGFPRDVYAGILKYRELLGGRTKLSYVIVEAVRNFLAADRDFQAQREREVGAGAATEPLREISRMRRGRRPGREEPSSTLFEKLS